MKIAKCLVSGILISDGLCFPEGTRILSIRENTAFDTFELLITNDTMNEVEVGEEIPDITPVMRTTVVECGHVEKVELIDWGYRK